MDQIVTERTPTAQERRELVARVAASRTFQKSARQRDVLVYLCDRVLSEPHVAIREQDIGTVVFGRAPEYDTGQDNIVRVHVSELRRRLEKYFASEGDSERLGIEIPKGSYIPVFKARQVPEPPSTRYSTPSWALPVSLALCLGLSVACAMLLIQNRKAATPSLGPHIAPLWSRLLAPEQRTDVVLADSNLSLFQDLTGRSLSLNDYLNRRYWGAAGHTGLAPERVRDLEVLMSRRYTSISDADFVRQLLSLERARNIRLSLYMARDYGMQDLQTNNVILVGSRRSNPWVELFEDRLNFLFEVDPANLLPRYRNRRPQPNEQAFYSVGQKEDGDAYGDIAFLPNLGRSGNALLISGTGIQAIRAGAECITSDDRFASVHKLLMQHPAKDGLPFFEVLFRTKRVGGSSTGFEVVASRVGNYVR